jgi:hypothetical protein
MTVTGFLQPSSSVSSEGGVLIGRRQESPEKIAADSIANIFG